MPRIQYEDTTVHLQGLDLALRIWRPPPSTPLTARAILYPGWLDNAGSYDTLAPLLALLLTHRC